MGTKTLTKLVTTKIAVTSVSVMLLGMHSSSADVIDFQDLDDVSLDESVFPYLLDDLGENLSLDIVLPGVGFNLEVASAQRMVEIPQAPIESELATPATTPGPEAGQAQSRSALVTPTGPRGGDSARRVRSRSSCSMHLDGNISKCEETQFVPESPSWDVDIIIEQLVFNTPEVPENPEETETPDEEVSTEPGETLVRTEPDEPVVPLQAPEVPGFLPPFVPPYIPPFVPPEIPEFVLPPTTIASIPEPGSMGILLLGLLGVGYSRRNRAQIS